MFPLYEKALQLNPENPIANLYYGLAQNTKAGALGDSYNGNNYDNYKQTTLVPILKDAASSKVIPKPSRKKAIGSMEFFPKRPLLS